MPPGKTARHMLGQEAPGEDSERRAAEFRQAGAMTCWNDRQLASWFRHSLGAGEHGVEFWDKGVSSLSLSADARLSVQPGARSNAGSPIPNLAHNGSLCSRRSAATRAPVEPVKTINKELITADGSGKRDRTKEMDPGLWSAEQRVDRASFCAALVEP
ncbi:hypothetical protein BU16DRAFT_556932 [Lophium mytilinum]|uniref:Uncharacterized protein n=1 Tax=Lophium mytilinum TaxID=390894 RepID=A0A6A6R6S6_9PEZI|nr:hypothetical protein BU16DRAFT_556932 [Lophium mytilinum]